MLVEVRYEAVGRVSARLQCMLDALAYCPAIVKNSIWDVVAWNSAAAQVLTDHGAIPPERRKMLGLLFTDPRIWDAYPDWAASVRFVVAVFRADTARAGALKRAEKLVAELCQSSPEFDAMWHNNDVRTQEDGTKHLTLPNGGQITLDYLALAVIGQAGLTMMVFTPATPTDTELIRSLLTTSPAGSAQVSLA